MATVHLDDTHLDYLEQGTGDPVVLVHGSSSDRRTWQAQLPVLGERFRVVAYSRRYHWPNDAIAEGADYAMQEHVDDLASLLRALDLGPANLVGHSYGAFVCLLLAIQQPDLVRALVLAEPPVLTLFVSNRPKPTELLRVFFTRPRTALEIVKFGTRGIGPATAAVQAGQLDKALEIFGAAVLGTQAFESLSPDRREQVRANFFAAEFLGSGFATLRSGDVRTVGVPVLLVTGQHSPRLFHRFADRLGELLPHAERLEIPAASHIVQEDNPTAYNDAVLSFLVSLLDGGQDRSSGSSLPTIRAPLGSTPLDAPCTTSKRRSR